MSGASHISWSNSEAAAFDLRDVISTSLTASLNFEGDNVLLPH